MHLFCFVFLLPKILYIVKKKKFLIFNFLDFQFKNTKTTLFLDTLTISHLTKLDEMSTLKRNKTYMTVRI